MIPAHDTIRDVARPSDRISHHWRNSYAHRTVRLAAALWIHFLKRMAGPFQAGMARPQASVLTTLCYHSVRKEERDAFEKQMDLLLECSAAAGTDHGAERYVHEPGIVVTFDDGFVSITENALPVLESRNIPSILFIPTEFIGAKPGWLSGRCVLDSDQMVMDAAEIRSVSSPLVSIGSHCSRHVALTGLPEYEVLEELHRSKRILEDITGKPVDLLAFPHGVYDDRIVELAKQAGYRHAFTLSPVYGARDENGFLIRRESVSPRDWILEFYLKIMGDYLWLPYLKRTILRPLW